MSDGQSILKTEQSKDNGSDISKEDLKNDRKVSKRDSNDCKVHLHSEEDASSIKRDTIKGTKFCFFSR